MISTASGGAAAAAKLDAFDGNVTALVTAIDGNNAPSALSVGSLSYTYKAQQTHRWAQLSLPQMRMETVFLIQYQARIASCDTLRNR